MRFPCSCSSTCRFSCRQFTMLSTKLTVLGIALYMVCHAPLSTTSVPILVRPRRKRCTFNIKTGFFTPKGCLPRPIDLPECSVCNSSASCATALCLRHRCVRNTRKSKLKCFGPQKLPKCAECARSAQCSTGLCLRRKCVFKGRRATADCVRRN